MIRQLLDFAYADEAEAEGSGCGCTCDCTPYPRGGDYSTGYFKGTGDGARG